MVCVTGFTASRGFAWAAERGVIILADTTTFIFVWIEPVEVVVYPRPGRHVDEGGLWALALGFQDIRDGRILACCEATAELLLSWTVCDVDIVYDEVDWRSDVKVGIDAVEVGDQVRLRREGEALI